MRRVAITGIGLISPLGVGVEAYWAAAAEGRSGVRAIDAFDTADLSVRFGGVAPAFDAERWLEKKTIRNTDRFVHLAVAASGMALEDAGLRAGEAGLDPARVGVVVGSGVGGLETHDEQITRYALKGPGRVSPFYIPAMIVNGAPGHVALQFGLTGPNFATVSACATSAHALGVALLMLRSGHADVILAGGSEAALSRLGLAAFSNMRALSTRNDAPARACRPFDKDRDGFVMGDGAGVFALEDMERARARGARIYAELAGFGASDDAYHLTAPEPEGKGAAQAMRQALEDAGVEAEAVGLVSAHATSTPLGDIAETLAIKRAFGDHARRLAVSATKSQTGHLLGAAASISVASAILALRQGTITPTINLDAQDPACDLDCVANVAQERAIGVALANSFGFGGHNASLVLKRA